MNLYLFNLNFVMIIISNCYTCSGDPIIVESNSVPVRPFRVSEIKVNTAPLKVSEPLRESFQPGIVQPSSPAPPPYFNDNSEIYVNKNGFESSETDLRTMCLKPRGQFPSNQCNKYVNCWDGIATEEVCPEGLLFNPKNYYCDFPINVNCIAAIQGTPPPLSASTSITPEPTLTSQSSSHLTPPQGPSTPPTVIATLPPDNSHLKSKCLRRRGQFPSESCNKYVNCWDDIVVEQECPEGLLFSDKGYCDYPHAVDCQNRLSSSEDVSKTKDCPLDYGTFRDKFNCSVFYTCMGGKIIAKYNCPQGFSYNDNLGVCDYSERVTSCDQEPLIFNPRQMFLKNIPKEYMEKIGNCIPGEVFRLNPQCSIAGVCRDNLSEIIHCPNGLSYDSKTDKCLLPQFAKC